MHRYILTLCSIIFMSNLMFSQDLHYSYYHFTPLTVNPALAGAYNGSYRVGGIFKSQFFQAANTQGYTTLNLFIDAPIIRGFRKNDWIGIGLETNVLGWAGNHINKESTSPDQMLTGNSLNWTNFKAGAAYHFSLNKKQTSIITLGAQYNTATMNFHEFTNLDSRYGIVTRKPDPDIDAFLRQRSGGGNNTNPNQQGIRLGYKDWNVGLLFNKRGKDSDLKIGASVEGFLRPRIPDNTNRKPVGINAHASYEMSLNKRTKIEPAAYYYSLGSANALNINGQVKYLVNEEKEFTLTGGLGMRNLRQAILLGGAQFKEYRVGASFDLDISTYMPASQNVGGFEIALIYMGKIYKRPKPEPVIFCPRL